MFQNEIDADIFEFDGKVYKTGVDWIEEEGRINKR